MGTYLNPGIRSYRMAVDSEVFVDKSAMIARLNPLVNTGQRFVSVSRPRRFGKTMAADMLCAYYGRGEGARELFGSLNLSHEMPTPSGAEAVPWDAHLGKFDVVRVVMTDFFREGVPADRSLERLQRLVTRDIRLTYPEVDYFDEDDLAQSMADVYARVGGQFVVVIDEWDAAFRAGGLGEEGQRRYLDFLRDWLKDKEYVALAYMTGILPIKKYGGHSALNMFDEYSMLQPMALAEFAGFTDPEVRELCDEYEMEYADVSDWYDGYVLSDHIPVGKRRLFRLGGYRGHRIHVYSPLSVVRAMRSGSVDNYWNKTETYEALAEYIRMDYDGLKEAVALLMDGGRVRVDLAGYQNDMSTFNGRDDVFALLVHLGYLGFEGDETTRGVDSEHGEVFIPNREVREEFETSTRSAEWSGTFRAFERSKELLCATWERDEERVASLLEAAHDRAANKTYNDEAALSYAIQLAYYAAQKYYTTILELDTGKGYADVVYLPSPRHPHVPALLVELKFEDGVDTALRQIRNKKYPARLEHYKGNMLLVGISYDREARSDSPGFKRHTCRIELA